MVEAAPAAALVVPEPDFLLEVLVVPLDAPAQLSQVDHLLEADLLRQGRQPVLRRLRLATTEEELDRIIDEGGRTRRASNSATRPAIFFVAPASKRTLGVVWKVNGFI